nr:unnamed protein product [Ipomoea trifida]
MVRGGGDAANLRSSGLWFAVAFGGAGVGRNRRQRKDAWTGLCGWKEPRCVADLLPELHAPDDLEATNDPEAARRWAALRPQSTSRRNTSSMSVYDPSETWNQKREGDLEAMNDPEAADDPEAVRTTSRTKTKPSETWNQKREGDLEVMNDPEAADDPEVMAGDLEAMNDPEAADDLEVLGVKAAHKFRGMKAKHEFRWFEEPKQSQVRLGTKRWRVTSRTKTKPSKTWNQKMEDDLEAMNNPEAADDPEAVRTTSRY